MLHTIVILFFASSVQAQFDFLGGNNCGYQQSYFPLQSEDVQHSMNVRGRQLNSARIQAEREMSSLNAELDQARQGLSYYFQRPWVDAMMTHMDNGLDCCAPGRAVATEKIFNDLRMPAGSDYEVVNPNPIYEQPEDSGDSYQRPQQDYSCNGYAKNYCGNDWGQNDAPSSGGLCLQTGFAASKAWYGAACRSGGKINPEVCGDARISRYPKDYQQCLQVLNDYYQISRQKRQLSGEIQAYNDDISGLRNPGRGQGFGKFVGQLLLTAAPFLLMNYMEKQSQKSVRYQYQLPGPSPSYLYGRGSMGNPNSLSGRYSGDYSSSYQSRPYAPNPSYYGENYGYPYQNSGNLGQLLPALMSGAFGCSQGSSGAGMGLMGLLMGGGARFNAQFGTGDGYAPPYMRPYQSGGIYNDVPGVSGRRPYAVLSNRSGYGGNFPQDRYNNYLGNGYRRDAYFYSQINNAHQRLWQNDYLLPRPQIDFGMGSAYGSNGYRGAPYLGAFAPGADLGAMMQSFMGVNPRMKFDFNLNTSTGY